MSVFAIHPGNRTLGLEEARPRVVEPDIPSVVSPFDRSRQRERFEDLAKPVDVLDLSQRHVRHGRAKPGIPIDELLGCETLEGLAEGRGADTIFLDELGGTEPLSRGEFAGHDVPADRVLDLAHQRGTADPPVTAHRHGSHGAFSADRT